MIAIDTNVLLRYLLNDDQHQATIAEQLINGAETVLITDVVLVETLWTLKGKKYQLNKTDLVAVIQALFKEPNIRFENGQTVWLALNDYRNAQPVGGKVADFSDALIVNKAKYIANNQAVELKGVFTFDIAAQQLSGTKAPTNEP